MIVEWATPLDWCIHKCRKSDTLDDLPPFERGRQKVTGRKDEHGPILNQIEQWHVFSPPFEGGAGGGELTISINLTLIDALLISEQTLQGSPGIP